MHGWLGTAGQQLFQWRVAIRAQRLQAPAVYDSIGWHSPYIGFSIRADQRSARHFRTRAALSFLRVSQQTTPVSPMLFAMAVCALPRRYEMRADSRHGVRRPHPRVVGTHRGGSSFSVIWPVRDFTRTSVVVIRPVPAIL